MDCAGKGKAISMRRLAAESATTPSSAPPSAMVWERKPSARRARRHENVRLHAGFDRARSEALGDGASRSFDGAVETGRVASGDFAAEGRSLNEADCRVAGRGGAAGHLPSIDRALGEAGAGEVAPDFTDIVVTEWRPCEKHRRVVREHFRHRWVHDRAQIIVVEPVPDA